MILSILNEIAADNSRLAKEAILKREIDNELLKAVILAAYNPYINYFQKKIPEATSTGKFSLIDALRELDVLSNRTLTGHAAIDYLTAVLSNISADDAEVIKRIVGRDLKCGFSESTANKVWPNLVPTFDVMTCHKDISSITYPAIAQTKMDGARCHLHYDGKEATAYARSGKIFKLHDALNNAASIIMQPGETCDGELLFLNKDGSIMDRKTSNGFANKALKGTISEAEAAQVIFVVWDIVDFTSKIEYKDRFKALYDRFFDSIQLGFKINCRLVRSEIVDNQEEAYQFYEKQRADKQEGAILKNLKGKWEPKRSKDCGKMKAEEEADLEIIAWEYGTGKNKNRMGNLVVATSDRKLVCGVGTGFSDTERDEEWVVGSIVTVRYNEIIKDKKSDTYSLFLPRFIERRFDKKVANKFEELK